MEKQSRPVLSVQNLSLSFVAKNKSIQALDNISFSVNEGETFALVGESGCGKSVTMMAILGLLPKSTAKISADEIRVNEVDLRTATHRQMRKVRGRRIGMIFQDPMTSLTPVHSVGAQISEMLRQHLPMGRQEAQQRAVELLDLVRIPDARRRVSAYPHELSGGMRQRVMIAMALACKPELLIADEPTTALDVTVQAQIMELLTELQREMNMAIVLITHDLGVVASAADRVGVMYAGKIVERASVTELFQNPSHGYTAGLLNSLPTKALSAQKRLNEIPGNVPQLVSAVPHCAFAARCEFATSECECDVLQSKSLSAMHETICLHHTRVQSKMSDHEIVRAWK